jgi:hypothetical protein
MIRTVLALVLMAAPAAAQEPGGAPMTGAEFDSYVTGRTLMFGTIGAEPYGGEDYLPGNRVRWSFLDGRCLEGIWFEAAPNICFVYSDDPEPICWTFFEGPGGLTALLDGDPDEVLYETGEAEEPLFCLGPDVGV